MESRRNISLIQEGTNIILHKGIVKRKKIALNNSRYAEKELKANKN